jgi:hypothetical protein
MQRICLAFVAGLLMFSAVGCGYTEPSVRASDSAAKNTSDPPDMTKFIVSKKKV